MFSAILDDPVLRFYLSNVKDISTSFSDMVAQIKKQFLANERPLALVREWDKASHLSYMKQHPNKHMKSVPDSLIPRIHELQICLPHCYHDINRLENSLLNACDGV